MKKYLVVAALVFTAPALAIGFGGAHFAPHFTARSMPHGFSEPHETFHSAPATRPAYRAHFIWVPIYPHAAALRKCDPQTDKRHCN